MPDAQQKRARPSGMSGFLVVWAGQFVSILASGMSGFALTIWMYQQTGSATAMGLMQVFYITPFLLLSPIAGVMVDRYNRKLMMMVSDLFAGAATVVLLILFATGKIEFWMLYVANIFYGIGNTFQWPAYSAAITTMIPKEQYGRANGLMSLLEAGPGVIAPLAAGALLPFIQIQGILFIDVTTFLVAIAALLVVAIPQPVRTQEGTAASGSMLKEAAFGFKYIFDRPSLLGLQLIFFIGNLFTGIAFTVFAPMILARTGQNSLVYGTVQTFGAIGAVMGGVIMSVWGGFNRRVHGVLGGWALSGLGMVVLGIGQGLVVWSAALFFTEGLSPLVNTSNQSIWQAKVAPDLQGRVFSSRRLIAWFTNPISPIIGGLLADYVLGPAMMTGSTPLAQAFGWLVGTGPGAGMALEIVFCGLGAASVGLAGYLFRPVREAESILPDHDQLPLAQPEPAGD
ncbi:MAG: Major facilitator superfamily 1 [Chloroflexi bacterium]|nr:Major facilitator superfamily 1 [Chloroflexota bacterium]